LLALQLAQIDCLDEQIDTLSAEITRRLAALSDDAPSVMAPEPTSEGAASPLRSSRLPP